MTTGTAYRVPTRDIIEKGIRGQDPFCGQLMSK